MTYRGQRGMPDRPHDRPIAILTARFAVAFGPRRIARPVADIRAALKSNEVRLTPGSLNEQVSSAWFRAERVAALAGSFFHFVSCRNP